MDTVTRSISASWAGHHQPWVLGAGAAGSSSDQELPSSGCSGSGLHRLLQRCTQNRVTLAARMGCSSGSGIASLRISRLSADDQRYATSCGTSAALLDPSSKDTPVKPSLPQPAEA